MKAVPRMLTVLLIGFVVGSAWGQTTHSPRDLLQLLHTGGYVVVFRHGATNADQADTDPLNPSNISKQRQLNDNGRSDAKVVGEVFKTAGVPIGKSYSSQFHRAVETAQLIGGKAPQTTPDVTEGGLVVSPNENSRRAHTLRAMVADPPEPGTNTLVVTHKPNILDAFGEDWFKVTEGEASIFKPDGNGGYSLIGRVPIDQWTTAK